MKPIAAVTAVVAIVVAWTALVLGRGRLRVAHENMRRYSMPGARTYDLVTHVLFRERYRDIARQIAAEVAPGSRILDVGCGPGEVLIEVARRAPSIEATGVDIDAEMIARADRKAERALGRRGLARPRFVVADAASLPFEDASFDVVVSSYSVHHWPDRQAGLSEVMRVLRPGGRAIVWDIAPPHPVGPPGDAAHEAALHHAPPAPDAHGHGHGAIGAPGPSPLRTLRMLVQFGRIPANRYDFTKPAA